MTYMPTVDAYCCRRWPVTPLYPLGRCGYCGERPVVERRMP